MIQIRPDPVWNERGPSVVRLRFGAIANFEDVRSFFEDVIRQERGHGSLDRVMRIERLEKGRWIVELDHAGSVIVATPKMPQEK